MQVKFILYSIRFRDKRNDGKTIICVSRGWNGSFFIATSFRTRNVCFAGKTEYCTEMELYKIDRPHIRTIRFNRNPVYV